MRPNRFRAGALLVPLDGNAAVDHDRIRKVLVGHTIVVPRGSDSDPQAP
jgi:hypothetical protein